MSPPLPTAAPVLPRPRGPLSQAVLDAIGGPVELLETPGEIGDDALAGDDLHLALYACYELHYRSFAGVDPAWEWEPSLIALRHRLERRFLDGVAEAVPMRSDVEPGAVGDLLFELAAAESAPSLSRFLRSEGTLDQFREFAIHRSAYQLKEADPHTWAIPRLHGPPKAAMVEVQADEYGSGDPARVHATLFARSMDALGLDSSYGAYLNRIPGVTLATVNLMSALGLSRARRGAVVGHLAMFEMTSAVPNSRYAKGLRRLGLDGDALDFFDEHVEADSVHENIAGYDLAEGLARQEPELAAEIVWGAEAMLELEGRFAAALLTAFSEGSSSLLGAAEPIAA